MSRNTRVAADLRAAEAGTRDLIAGLQGAAWRDGAAPDAATVAALGRAADHLGNAARAIFHRSEVDNPQMIAEGSAAVLRIGSTIAVLLVVAVTPISFALAMITGTTLSAAAGRSGLVARLRRGLNSGTPGARVAAILARIETVRDATRGSSAGYVKETYELVTKARDALAAIP